MDQESDTDRLGNFLGGHFSNVNLSSVLFTHRVDNRNIWSAPGLTKPTFEEAMKQEFKPAKKGDSFGPSWTNHWWKVSLTIPGYWQQYERVQFEFDPGCEAMIFSTDGTPLQGITGGYGGDRRVEYIIPAEGRKKGTHEFIIESSCNGMFGVPWNGDTIAPQTSMNRYFSLASADLVVPNQEAWSLLWDFTTLREIIETLPGNTPLQNQALVAANEIMNVFNKGDATGIARARKLAEGVFGEGWEAKGAAIYNEGAKKSQIWGIGELYSNCHIDTAWLWPYRVTQQKVARSWATQVDLMNRYPEHRFTCSSAQQYKWLEQLYPPLFKLVKDKVLDGRFQPVGGSWVENDANMPSGEALIRQFLFGQRFFESRFGKRCETAWLPDSFGLTGALPQLIRGAGMNYFFTQKLSCNVFPHSTFNWVGIDGTQVLCHMTPVDTYTAQATVGDVNKGVTNHKNLESSNTALLVFGNGDGGGGPLATMLENLRRIRAVSNNHRELPPVSMGHSVEQFFENLQTSSGEGRKLPNWHGELYLEVWSIKKGNRHSEILLRDVEHVATLASFHPKHKSKYEYPKQKIDDSWEKVLLNQCIGMVYEDAEKLYAEVRKDGGKMLEDAFRVLFPRSMALADQMDFAPVPEQKYFAAYNTTFFPRRDVIEIPLVAIGSDKSLQSQVLQTSTDGKTGYALVDCANGGTLGLLRPANNIGDNTFPVFAYTNGSDHFVLRNSSVQLTISKGRITSLLDIQLSRELIPDGMTGGLVIFQDHPNYWDAWDVEIHHLETGRPLEFSNIAVVAEGPLRAAVKAEVKYGKSKITVTVSSVKKNSRSLFRFDAVVDWRQRHEFLKFELPLNIHSDNATYETQFGHVQRPTHKNTTWDAAKYADLSEYGYGVAILSESKYGFACQGNILRISLLRSATAPDADQDQGEHQFSWAVMPHEGHFLDSDVPMAAYIFNSPLHGKKSLFMLLRCLSQDPSIYDSALKSPFSIKGGKNVFLETIKRGEDDNLGEKSASKATATVVLRLYEAFGGHAQVQLHVASHINIIKAFATNLLEDDQSELKVSHVNEGGGASTIKLDFRGFEVKTVKLVLPPGAPPPRVDWPSVELLI
ncbi:glycoside hydrolase family 38 protein [Infundibulicybe gibba]|nr:glycoside hydrolase family 38 protein [Infundibulicybe gibba]